ncbi:hypothetical protein [Arthrospira sp. PCC 8006]|uniref:hypothetical protein n=1 Tax=Arthrospira sp. PCC 8006 TaxID=1982224 RepID=UPI00396F5EF1
MVNYSQSWRSRSVPARSIAYPLGSATYRLHSQKCVSPEIRFALIKRSVICN